MTKIKICGLKRPEDIEYVNELKPDFIGFIMAADYPKRYVDDEKAAALKRLLLNDIKAVGVFVNDDISHIVKVCAEGTVDIVQLHGEESADYARAVKEKTGVPVIKAVRVKSADDIIKAQEYPADYILFDTYVKGAHGGTGKSFNRTLIPTAIKNEKYADEDPCAKENGVKAVKPYILAGGLGVENLEVALKECSPYAVDLSSGVETNGVKDRNKISRVMEIIRNT